MPTSNECPQRDSSHALRVRGLKHLQLYDGSNYIKSHALRVRGLKRSVLLYVSFCPFVARSARAWIETIYILRTSVTKYVARSARAWIETLLDPV